MEEKEYVEAENRLKRLLAFGAPFPAWYTLMAELQLQRSNPLSARMIIEEGREAYPYSSELAVWALGFDLADKRITTLDEVIASDYPLVARCRVGMKLAIQTKDYVRALLLAERGAYADGVTAYETEAAAALATIQMALLDTTRNHEFAATWLDVPDTSMQHLYTRCLLEAADAIAKQGGDRTFIHDHLAVLRSATLRLFADRGYLARYPDPTLVDLYVLDRAGHVEATTAVLYSNYEADLFYKYRKRNRRDLRLAENYRLEDWGDDVDAFLDGIQ